MAITLSYIAHKIYMDKSTIIAKIAQEPEDRLLLARIWDKYEQTERKSIPAATVFLSPREQQLAQAPLNAGGVEKGGGRAAN